MGVSATMSVLNFMTAIYWGQLSRCTIDTSMYCRNPAAYGAVSAFSVLIFLLQSAFCAAMVLWRNELISEEGGLYDDVSGVSSQPHLVGGAYEHLKGSPYPSSTTSADL